MRIAAAAGMNATATTLFNAPVNERLRTRIDCIVIMCTSWHIVRQRYQPRAPYRTKGNRNGRTATESRRTAHRVRLIGDCASDNVRLLRWRSDFGYQFVET